MPGLPQPVPIQVNLPIVFLDAEERVYERANAFVLSATQDGIHITVGQIQPPVLLGTPEQQQAQAAQLSYVGVKWTGPELDVGSSGRAEG